MPELSIIIVNWNNCSFLDPCLRSILQNGDGLDYEVIVVDNASQDGSAEMVRRNFGECTRIQLIANTENTGFAHGNNQGYAVSSGQFIVTLNPDTLIQPHALQRMVDYAASHPEVGIVGCRFLNPDGSLQRHYTRVIQVSDVFFAYTVFGALLDRYLFQFRHRSHHQVWDLDFLSITRGIQVAASCLLIPRRVIKAIGGLFDEQFPIFFNDIDLCRRVLDHGFELHVLPDASVIHYLSRGVAPLGNVKILDLHNQGALRYFRKHHSARESALVLLIALFGRATNPVLLPVLKSLRHGATLARTQWLLRR